MSTCAPSHTTAAATLLACAVLPAGCGQTSPPPTSAKPVVIMTGSPFGAYHRTGVALAEQYRQHLKLDVEVRPFDGGLGQGNGLMAVENGEADIAFANSDVAFRAFRTGTDSLASPHTHLRAIARLWINAVHVLVRRESGIKVFADIRGHSFAMSREPGVDALVRIIIEGHGLHVDDVKAAYAGGDEAVRQIRNGLIDGIIFASAYPVAAVSERSGPRGMLLLPLAPSAIDRLRTSYPFFTSATIPGRTYPGQDQDVPTVGLPVVLTCRDSISEPLAYAFTQVLFDQLPALSVLVPELKSLTTDAAKATPMPLHPGAARYYRERDLFR